MKIFMKKKYMYSHSKTIKIFEAIFSLRLFLLIFLYTEESVFLTGFAYSWFHSS